METHPSAFEELVARHARLMAAAIRRVCGQRHGDLFEDVQQEVHLALWKRLQGGKEIRHPVSYLYKMALTTALRIVRKRDSQPMPLGDEDLLSRMDHRPERELLDTGERSRLLAEVLARVDPEEARALRAYLAGFGHQEVAELYGWTESVARHRIYRTLERLRAELGTEEET